MSESGYGIYRLVNALTKCTCNTDRNVCLQHRQGHSAYIQLHTHEGRSTAQQCVHVLNALSVCVHVLGTGTRGTESATSGSVTDTMVRAVEALCLNSCNLKTSQGRRRRLMMLPRPANASSRSLVLNTSVRYALSLLEPRLPLGQENSSRTLDSLYCCLIVLYCLDQNKWFWCPVNVAHTCGVCKEFSGSS